MPCPLLYGAATFLTSSKDGYLAIQYYDDWRAPPEKVTADCLLMEPGSVVKTWDASYRRDILHCRDPALGPSDSVGLCGMLKHYDSRDFERGIKQLRRYKELETWSNRVTELEETLDKSANLSTESKKSLKTRMAYARGVMEKIMDAMAHDRDTAMAAAEAYIEQQARKMQAAVDDSVARREFQWSPAALEAVADCRVRGDVRKFNTIMEWMRANA